jgi:hypothetical protein
MTQLGILHTIESVNLKAFDEIERLRNRKPKHNTMKKLTTLEQVLRVFRVERTEENIEKLDKIIQEWDDPYLQRFVDRVFDSFDVTPQPGMNGKIMAWIDHDMYEYLQLKVGQSLINQFGDTLTKEKGYAVNIRADLKNVHAPGSVTICRFEHLKDAKAWINDERGEVCEWRYNK